MRVAPAADEVVPAADVEAPAADSLPVISMSALPTEVLQHIVKQASNVLDPYSAVCLSSASKELRGSTEAVRQQQKRAGREVRGVARAQELQVAQLPHPFARRAGVVGVVGAEQRRARVVVDDLEVA